MLKSGHRPAHRECDGRGHCQWELPLPKDATLPPGSAWCRSRCLQAIGRSLAASASVVIAICAGRGKRLVQTWREFEGPFLFIDRIRGWRRCAPG